MKKTTKKTKKTKTAMSIRPGSIGFPKPKPKKGKKKETAKRSTKRGKA